MKKDQNQTAPVQGRIADGKNASAFSSCGNVRKSAARKDGQQKPGQRQ